MALVPFSYSSPFHNPKELSERFFCFPDYNVSVKQDWKADGKGGTEIGFGAAVYDGAFVLAEYLSRNREIVESKRVLELGAGTALVSVVASKSGARTVFATDGDIKSVELSAENLRRNSVVDGKACILLWGEDTSTSFMNENGCVDVIVASDIIAFPYKENFPLLLKTLLTLSKTGTSLWIAYEPRNVVEAEFFRELSLHFTTVDIKRENQLHADFALNSPIELHHLVRHLN